LEDFFPFAAGSINVSPQGSDGGGVERIAFFTPRREGAKSQRKTGRKDREQITGCGDRASYLFYLFAPWRLCDFAI